MTAFWWSSPASNSLQVLFLLLIFLLPVQFGKHFWPDFSYLNGLRSDYLSPTLYLTDGVIFLILVIALPPLLDKLSRKTIFFAGSIILFFFISSLLSAYPANSVYGFLRMLGYLSIAWIGSTLFTRGGFFQKAKVVFLVSASFVSLLAIAQFYLQRSFGGWLYWFGERTFSAQTPGIAAVSLNGEVLLRPYATFPHPNILAGYLLFVITLLLFYPPFSLQQKYRWVSLLLFVFLSIGLLITFSRVAILLWLGILLLVIFKYFKTKKYTVLLFTLVIVTVLLTPLGTRFRQTSFLEEGAQARIELLEQSGKIIQTSPVIGVGMHNFLPTLADTSPALPYRSLQPVHNIFVLFLTETGLVGLTLLLFTFRQMMRRVLLPSSQRISKVVLLSCILVIGSIDHYFLTLHQGQILLAIMLSVLWAIPMDTGRSSSLGPRSKGKYPNLNKTRK